MPPRRAGRRGLGAAGPSWSAAGRRRRRPRYGRHRGHVRRSSTPTIRTGSAAIGPLSPLLLIALVGLPSAGRGRRRVLGWAPAAVCAALPDAGLVVGQPASDLLGGAVRGAGSARWSGAARDQPRSRMPPRPAGL